MFKKFFSGERSVRVSPSIVIFTVFFVLGLYFLYYILNVMVMLFSAIILMAALNPAITKLEKKYRVPRPLGIVLMYILLIAFVASAAVLIVPPLISQLQLLGKYFDVDPLIGRLRTFNFTVEEIRDFVGSFGGSINALFGVINSAFAGLFTIVTILVMSVYLLIERKELHKKIQWFTRDGKMLRLGEEFVDSIEHQLGGWVRGQFILMLLIGFITYVGLIVLGIPYALPLALIAGFLEIVPNLGPTIASIPAVIFAFAYGGWILCGITIFFYIVVQQLENNLVVPKIMKDNVDVNPLVTILTILIGLKMAGVVGALLSVPVYIVIRTLYSFWLRENRK